MGFRYRSSVTGRWVREKFARRHKRITQRERVGVSEACARFHPGEACVPGVNHPGTAG